MERSQIASDGDDIDRRMSSRVAYELPQRAVVQTSDPRPQFAVTAGTMRPWFNPEASRMGVLQKRDTEVERALFKVTTLLAVHVMLLAHAYPSLGLFRSRSY